MRLWTYQYEIPTLTLYQIVGNVALIIILRSCAEFPSFFSIKKKVKKSGSGSGSKTLPTGNSPSRHVESPAMSRRLPVDPSEAIGTAIVKYNYQAQQPDELSLSKGIRILILEKSNDGYVFTWCYKFYVLYFIFWFLFSPRSFPAGGEVKMAVLPVGFPVIIRRKK